jgi:hypothetical protein
MQKILAQMIERIIEKYGEETNLLKLKEELDLFMDKLIERYGEKTSILDLKKDVGKDIGDVKRKLGK